MTGYTDYFLKFENKAQAESVFLSADVGVNGEGKLPSYTMVGHDAMAIDVLFGTGIVMRKTGNKIIVDGEEIDEMVPSDGYHVNVRYFGEMFPSALVPYAIEPAPANPKCMFAG